MIDDWLKSRKTEEYRESCSETYEDFVRFLIGEEGWATVTGQDILTKYDETKDRDFYFDLAIPRFAKYLQKTRGISLNTSVVYASRIRGLFKHYRRPIKLQENELAIEETVDNYHVFRKDELSRMLNLGTIEEKALFLTGLSTGLRIGDILSLRKEDLEKAFEENRGEFPIGLQVKTQKRRVVANCFITQECWTVLHDYWSSQKKQSEWAFSGENGKKPMSQQWVGRMLERGWLRAYPDSKLRVRFHGFRAYTITALADSGLTDAAIRKITGKKIDASLNPYVKGLDLRSQFVKAQDRLTFLGNGNGGTRTKISELEATIGQLEKENQTTRTRLELSIKRYDEFFAGMTEWREGLEEAFKKLEENAKEKKNPS